MPPLPPIHCEAAVLRHEEVAREVYWLVLGVDGRFPPPDPGQFVFLKVSDGLEPFLRRPMSILGFRRRDLGSELEILYRVVGRGTQLLTLKRVRDRVDLIGPLGQGFRTGGELPKVLVAGGMGMAPLFFLAADAKTEDTLLLGCRSATEFPVDFIGERVAIPFRVVTEDGSRGATGLASDLAEELAAQRGWAVELAAAGPPAMLAAVSALGRTHGVRCQVSVEARMACGVGSCLGCVIPTRTSGTYQRACKEGPVFDAEEIRWEALP